MNFNKRIKFGKGKLKEEYSDTYARKKKLKKKTKMNLN